MPAPSPSTRSISARRLPDSSYARHMDISALTGKAMHLRQHFGETARTDGRRERTREEVMQGFVVDVGALTKLVMAKSGLRDVPNVDQKLGHELADCLWSVLVLAKLYEIDLEHEFLAMIAAVPKTPEAAK